MANDDLGEIDDGALNVSQLIENEEVAPKLSRRMSLDEATELVPSSEIFASPVIFIGFIEEAAWYNKFKINILDLLCLKLPAYEHHK